ncbi:MAG: cell division protein FtsL [Acidiferrobacterales bacterium]
MDKRAMVLVVLIVISALSVITLRQQSRMSFAELQTLERQRDNLNIEWGRLLLEQGAWSQHQRVEKIARTKLGMQIPDSNQIDFISPRGQMALNDRSSK